MLDILLHIIIIYHSIDFSFRMHAGKNIEAKSGNSNDQKQLCYLGRIGVGKHFHTERVCN